MADNKVLIAGGRGHGKVLEALKMANMEIESLKEENEELQHQLDVQYRDFRLRMDSSFVQCQQANKELERYRDILVQQEALKVRPIVIHKGKPYFEQIFNNPFISKEALSEEERLKRQEILLGSWVLPKYSPTYVNDSKKEEV